MKELYGKWPGIVTNNQDTDGMKRLKVKVPALFGQDEIAEWALPCLPPGVDTVPNQGDGVWVEFAGGDENAPIWSGVWFNQKGQKPGTEFKKMVNEAAVDIFNNHTHAYTWTDGGGSGTTEKPGQQLVIDTHTTKQVKER